MFSENLRYNNRIWYNTIMTILTLIILALVTSRITQLITTDTILDKPRTMLHMRYPSNDSIYTEWHPVDKQVYKKELKKNKPISLYKRTWLKYEHKYSLSYESRPGTFIGNLTSCTACLSIWVAALVYTAWHYAPQSLPILIILAISQAVIIIDNLSTKDEY